MNEGNFIHIVGSAVSGIDKTTGKISSRFLVSRLKRFDLLGCGIEMITSFAKTNIFSDFSSILSGIKRRIEKYYPSTKNWKIK
jgi:hypothetical protein